ncbi:hypothetical protein O6H91_19G009100 [Diphasiastrum complanatum]|uniref:Uncharacterized protein n=1 Tax=Diphasiastrum complanatum TaxID=34168 RepID=A0ACC2ASJ7_DIPCM|nr:hypothetical protein O6H91_19G009100 [Diphasiastrum complanatum]
MALAVHGATFLKPLAPPPFPSSSSTIKRVCYKLQQRQPSKPALQKMSGRRNHSKGVSSVKAVSIQESFIRLEEGGEGGEPQTAAAGSNVPKGLQRYETMAVLRSDITETQRLELSQRYEEAIVAGGGMDVEIFNRGIMPLAYTIKTKNMGGVGTKYLDGIYFLFTYVTKPESQVALQQKLNADDDIIRSSTFRIKKEKVAKT